MCQVERSSYAENSSPLAQISLSAWVFSFITRVKRVALACFTAVAYAFSTSRFSTKLLAEVAVLDAENPNEKLLIALAVLGVDFSLVEVPAPRVSHRGLPSKVSILQKAACAKTPALLKALLPHVDVNAVCSDFGDSLLHAAVYNALQKKEGWQDFVGVLLGKGADPNAKNQFGLTPLSCIQAEMTENGEDAYRDLFELFSTNSLS